MANIFIEKFAVTAISQYMMDCKVLVPYIDDNDKTPMWDGDIYIYNSEEINNENFKGRYPLQIKGTKITEDFAETTSFSVRINDLINYSHEGGCAFFVVQERWDEEEETTKTQIFHNLLSKDDINFLLKDKSDTQNTTTIHLSRVPKKKSEFVTELNRYLDIKLKYQEEADPIESKEDGWKPIQVIPILKHLSKVAEKAYQIEDEDIRTSIIENIDSLLSLKYTPTSRWRDKIIAFTYTIIKESKDCIDDECRAILITDYALFFMELHFYKKAESYFNEALGVFRRLVETNASHIYGLACVLSNLAYIHDDNDNYTLASKEYSEALNIYKELDNQEPNIYKQNLIDVINGLAALYIKTNDYNSASQELSEAWSIIKELSENEL